MPPHCDTLDGPVVAAAREALAADEVELALCFVPEDAEDEVRTAFDLAREARRAGGPSREVADLYFFDTVVRVHRRGEGAPHTGLKPAGLDVGPVIPVAEEAVNSGDPEPLSTLLGDELREQTTRRVGRARTLADHAGEGLPAAREATTARLELLVWSHKLYATMQAGAHEDGHEHGHRHEE